MGQVRVAVLGTAEIVVDGVRQEIGAAKHRALLSILAMHAGRRVGVDTIVDALWGELPPAGAMSTLQGYVADLRKLLELDRAPREQPRLLVTDTISLAETPAVFESLKRRTSQCKVLIAP